MINSISIQKIAFLVSALSLLAFVSPETAHAKRLSKVELRKLGFAGSYRGFVSGSTNTWNGAGYTVFPVNQSRTEAVPTSSTVLVTAPTNTNAFFLSHFPATGNSRKATIRANYSGVSFNSFYNTSMIGSGGKTLTIRKKGKSNPRYVMSFSDTLYERAQVGGQLYTFWRIGGSLTKR
jgi:hypothetical protein